MKITSLTRFPHPVLSPDSTDYLEGEFEGEIINCEDTAGRVTFNYRATLTEPELNKLVERDEAEVGLFIQARDTIYHRLHSIELGENTIEFSEGELWGETEFRPVIYASDEIKGFSGDNLHDEFGDKWDFARNDLLAFDEVQPFWIGPAKHRELHTVFQLVVKDDVPLNQTRVELDGQKISICACKDTRDVISKMRYNTLGRRAVLNGVYFPAVMEVLLAMREKDSDYEGKTWFEVFSAKCIAEGIDLESTSRTFHELAQHLLRSPLKSLVEDREFSES